MGIFKKVHSLMKAGRIPKVVKEFVEEKENKNVRKTKKHRRRSAQGNT